jgi:hypothetical protein
MMAMLRGEKSACPRLASGVAGMLCLSFESTMSGVGCGPLYGAGPVAWPLRLLHRRYRAAISDLVCSYAFL